MEATALKHLQTKIIGTKKEITRLGKEQSEIGKEITRLIIERNQIRAQIRKFTDKITVSEHAMLRFLQRYRGVDLDILANDILSEEDGKIIEELGDCEYLAGAHKVVVKSNVVVTVK